MESEPKLLVLDAFSSREPVCGSLENAMVASAADALYQTFEIEYRQL
jgi:hypothetical protein